MKPDPEKQQQYRRLTRRTFGRNLVLIVGGTVVGNALGQDLPIVEKKPRVGPSSGRRFINDQITSEYRRTRASNGEVQFINAGDLSLSMSIVDPNSHLCVYAYEIDVTDSLKLPGRNVFLHANSVRFKEGTNIDLSGRDATPLKERAPDGKTPGEHGSKGLAGAGGQPGGALIIMCERLEGKLQFTSNGGAGAKGQDAGNGAPGSIGARGDKNRRPGRGTVGGDAGFGGAGGNGGDAGRMNAYWLSTCQQPSATGKGGKGAAGGANGKPGHGGPGGQGGYEEHWEPPQGDHGRR